MIQFYFFVCLLSVSLLQAGNERPLPVDFKNTTTYRWLNKEVIKSRLLDDMEATSRWELSTG